MKAMPMTPSTYRPAARLLFAVALILMVPLVAMQFTEEVRWGPFDFLVAGALLFGTGFTYQLVARKAAGIAYRAAVGVALAAALLLVWLNLAVGIIGDEGNPANLMYIGVLVVGVIGSLVARFRPYGMAAALVAMALAQSLIAIVALTSRFGAPEDGPLQILALNGFFVALFVGSAYLFRRAALGPLPGGAAAEAS